jgi:hypothetical protein
MTNELRKKILGFFALFFLVTYLLAINTDHANHWRSLADASLRLTVIFGIIWLAWDDLLSIPKWLYIFLPIVILAVIFFPKITPIVIAVAVPTWFLLKFLRFISQPLPPQQKGTKRK